jgi:subtilisin family serine protease
MKAAARRRDARAVVLAMMLLAGCTGLKPSGNPDDLPKQFRARQIIVTLSEDLRDQWQAIDRDILSRYRLEAAGEFPLTSIRVNCLVYRVPESFSVEDVLRRLKADPRIRLVQANQVFEALGGGPDPYAGLAYAPKLIGADRAHRLATGRAVPIAVIDTGADKDHPDLKGRIVQIQNFVEGGDTSFADDRHGTAVAGVIAAGADDGIGMYGIAPEGEVAALKACWYANPADAKASCASWTLAKAIDFAINAGSRVLNLSLAGPADALLTELLETAERRGIVAVAAAAEGKAEPGFPASLATVIPVVSTNPEGLVTHPTWHTPAPPIAAPGVEILTTAPREGYDFLSGSSLAAAHVSGVIALLLQEKPELKPAEIRQLLLRTGRPDSGASAAAIPIVDACRALAGLEMGLNCP